MENVNWVSYVQKEFQPVGGKVVAYFHDAFYSLWNSGMRKELEMALDDHPSAEVWVHYFENFQEFIVVNNQNLTTLFKAVFYSKKHF